MKFFFDCVKRGRIPDQSEANEHFRMGFPPSGTGAPTGLPLAPLLPLFVPPRERSPFNLGLETIEQVRDATNPWKWREDWQRTFLALVRLQAHYNGLLVQYQPTVDAAQTALDNVRNLPRRNPNKLIAVAAWTEVDKEKTRLKELLKSVERLMTDNEKYPK